VSFYTTGFGGRQAKPLRHAARSLAALAYRYSEGSGTVRSPSAAVYGESSANLGRPAGQPASQLGYESRRRGRCAPVTAKYFAVDQTVAAAAASVAVAAAASVAADGEISTKLCT